MELTSLTRDYLQLPDIAQGQG